MERNFLLTIEYDGTGFFGWQRQPEKKTVQGTLEQAIQSVCGREVRLEGTSRTDAGVHAFGQRATLRAELGIPADRLALAVNNRLSGGKRGRAATGPIRITKVDEMPAGFHARFDAKAKTYLYRIRNSHKGDVFCRNYCYQIAAPLDVQAMRRAAAFAVGTHDFCCFQAAGGNERLTTVRTIYEIRIEKEADDVEIYVTGDGFLYNMVRILTGTLVEAGLGKRTPASVQSVIQSRDRRLAGHTAPPQGLYLQKVYYETQEVPGYEKGTAGLG